MITIEFLVTSLIVVLIPGTGVVYTVSTGLTQGRRASVFAALGCTAGIVPHLLATVLGLAAVMHTSALAFQVLKFAGVAYLFYLAVATWRDKAAFAVDGSVARVSAAGLVVRAFLLNILNPKLTIFFLAFLPQFVDQAHGSAFLQFVLLGSIIAAIDMVYESLLAFIAGGISSRVMNNARVRVWRERITGLALVGLGIRLAFAKRT